MKIVGTIVEYNPLHKGHIYAINEIRKRSNADVLVAVLSGNFTMRGELSIFDKFEKTRQALKASIDLVLELPFVYAVQHSDIFASNAVTLLYQAGVEELWIGSEHDDPKLYANCYEKWKNPKQQEQIQKKLKTGISYKEATASVISLPSNDLLGFCYYKAIIENHYPMKIKTIKRVGDYNSLEPKEFASSYAIRSNLALASAYCPPYVDIKKIRKADWLFPYIKYKLITTQPIELKDIFFCEEGLENRLKKGSSLPTLDSLISFLSTKRYTKSRVQRLLAYLLCNIKKQDVLPLPQPKILRVLGYSSKGLLYLNQIKKNTTIITNIKEGIHPIWDIEIKITKLLDFIFHTQCIEEEQGKPQKI